MERLVWNILGLKIIWGRGRLGAVAAGYIVARTIYIYAVNRKDLFKKEYVLYIHHIWKALNKILPLTI
jgi:F0F1-type ATP synthase membrane subunit c/vacuolar-type H+-ATPase subunit K